MNTDLAIRQSSELTALATEARGYADNSRAANTTRAYRSDWNDFSAWCANAGAPSIPASAATVALYLTDRATSLSVASLARRRAAIAAAHRLADLPAPQSQDLARVWNGIQRAHGRPPVQKQALSTEALRQSVIAQPESLAGLRNRALLLIGFGGGLRRSEIAALCIAGTPDATITLTITAAGLDITLTRSKGDQLGSGAVVSIPNGARSTSCPVLAAQAWIAAAQIETGPVFRQIKKGGKMTPDALSPEAVASIVKDAAEIVGIDPKAIGGHSLRSGLATAAAQNDAPGHVIMRHLRHKKFETTERYIRQGNRFIRNASTFAGL
jgi:site-specific recombinase XerD